MRKQVVTSRQPRRRSEDKAGRRRVRLDVDERRAQLVELGLSEFAALAYDAVSIDLIAERAGISKGLLYHYFPTKRAFYVACIREAASRLLARVKEANTSLLASTTAPTPLDELRAGLEAYLAYVRGHGPAFATLMRGSGIDPEISEIVDETRQALLEDLTSGMSVIFPNLTGAVDDHPLIVIALKGWIGFAETTSIAWVETCLTSERGGPEAPSMVEVRDLLAATLSFIVTTVIR